MRYPYLGGHDQRRRVVVRVIVESLGDVVVIIDVDIIVVIIVVVDSLSVVVDVVDPGLLETVGRTDELSADCVRGGTLGSEGENFAGWSSNGMQVEGEHRLGPGRVAVANHLVFAQTSVHRLAHSKRLMLGII